MHPMICFVGMMLFQREVQDCAALNNHVIAGILDDDRQTARSGKCVAVDRIIASHIVDSRIIVQLGLQDVRVDREGTGIGSPRWVSS